MNDAAAAGIDKLRKPEWINPRDYMTIDIHYGEAGPWAHLYSEVNQQINGRNPVDMLNLEWRDEKAFLPWYPT